MTNEETINYFERSYASGDTDDERQHNEALDMAIKALEQEPYKDNTEGENECNKDCIHCRWTTCPLVEPEKIEPYTQKIKEIRNAYKEGYDEGYDRGYIIGEAQADAWLVIQEHINDILDKIRAEVEQRKKNSGGEPNRDLAFNVCLQIIDKYKYKAESEEE